MYKTTTLFLIIFVLIGSVVISGCASKNGKMGIQSHFSYPNSNVEPLGRVTSSFSRSSFFFSPEISKSDIRALMEQALKKKAGADFVINYKVDTEITTYAIIPYYSMEVFFEGTAVKMTVGLQELEEIKNKSIY